MTKSKCEIHLLDAFISLVEVEKIYDDYLEDTEKRLTAKAMNCIQDILLNRFNFDPYAQCPNCQEIAETCRMNSYYTRYCYLCDKEFPIENYENTKDDKND